MCTQKAPRYATLCYPLSQSTDQIDKAVDLLALCLSVHHHHTNSRTDALKTSHQLPALRRANHIPSCLPTPHPESTKYS